jgi:hypothetical protein
VTSASLASMGFGAWHFFVPKTWNWYAHISPAATELILAVRAINVFFSLSLVLFGLMNILLVFGNRSHKFSNLVVLGASCVLWLVRILFQIIYPQGSKSALLEYGMLAAFTAVFLGYSISLVLTVMDRSFG